MAEASARSPDGREAVVLRRRQSDLAASVDGGARRCGYTSPLTVVRAGPVASWDTRATHHDSTSDVRSAGLRPVGSLTRSRSFRGPCGLLVGCSGAWVVLRSAVRMALDVVGFVVPPGVGTLRVEWPTWCVRPGGLVRVRRQLRDAGTHSASEGDGNGDGNQQTASFSSHRFHPSS